MEWRAVASRLRQSTLARSSGSFIAGAFLQRSLPLLMLPILTRYLNPAEFGVVTLFLLAGNLMDPIVGLSTSSAVSRQFFERDQIDFPNYIANCLYLLVGTLVVVALAVAVGGDKIGALLSLPSRWLWVALLASGGRYVISLVLALWQVEKKAAKYVAFSVGQAIATFVISLLLIVSFGWGWQGRVVGEVVSTVSFAAIAFLFLRGRWVRFGVNKAHLRHALTFGSGLIPHAYGALLIAATDRVLLAKLTTVDTVGKYAVAAQVAQILAVLAAAFNLGWAPWYFERLKEGSEAARQSIRAVTRVYTVVILATALALTLVARLLLPFVVGPQFRDANDFVPWLCLGAAFGGMYSMSVNALFYANKTYLIPIATLSSGVINLVLNYALIKSVGPIGSAQATAISLFICYLITVALARWVRRESDSQHSGQTPTVPPQIVEEM